MKRFFKEKLKKILPPVAKKTVRDKVDQKNTERRREDTLLHSFFDILNQIKYIPGHIVDVGANHGNWTRDALKYFPAAYYTLLEPQQQMQASVGDLLKINAKIKFHAVGAGSKTGVFPFTIVDRDDSCSFMISAEEAKRQGLRQIEIPVVTLNQFLSTTNLPKPDIIKIDAEGLDLEVLSGADNYFGTTEIFMVEAGVMNKTFDNNVLKIINYMDSHGYMLFDVTDLNRPLTLKILWLVELVFIKRDGIIDKKIATYY